MLSREGITALYQILRRQQFGPSTFLWEVKAPDVARAARAGHFVMLYRNLLAMETEELLRSHPIDGAVLMPNCHTDRCTVAR